MNVHQYIDALKYIYAHEDITRVLAIISIVIGVVVWIILMIIPRISRKNKIGISFTVFLFIVLLVACVIQQSIKLTDISKDISMEEFITYEGEFDFNKRDPRTNAYHKVRIYDRLGEPFSLDLFDYVGPNDHAIVEEIIETGRYYGDRKSVV